MLKNQDDEWHEACLYHELVIMLPPQGETHCSLDPIFLAFRFESTCAAVISCLAPGIRNELSEVKGLSERNLKIMAALFREYLTLLPIGPRDVAMSG